MGTLRTYSQSSKVWEVQAERGLPAIEEELKLIALIEDFEDLHGVMNAPRQEKQG